MAVLHFKFPITVLNMLAVGFMHFEAISFMNIVTLNDFLKMY